MITYEPASRLVVSVAVVPGAMSSCSSTGLTLSSSTTPFLVGSASGASSVLMTTNSWLLGPSLEMLNVTEPAGALVDARSIAKSFSVAETPPAVEPPAEMLVLDVELLQATAPTMAKAAMAIVMRENNRSMRGPSCLYGSGMYPSP